MERAHQIHKNRQCRTCVLAALEARGIQEIVLKNNNSVEPRLPLHSTGSLYVFADVSTVDIMVDGPPFGCRSKIT